MAKKNLTRGKNDLVREKKLIRINKNLTRGLKRIRSGKESYYGLKFRHAYIIPVKFLPVSTQLPDLKFAGL